MVTDGAAAAICQECKDFESDPGDVLCWRCKRKPFKPPPDRVSPATSVSPDGIEGWRPVVGSTATTPRGEHSTVTAAAIQPESVSWLWERRIPLGMPTVIGGFPGVGKSTILYYLAAKVSREGKGVVIATAEDHLAAVARPRLEAAGADLERVHFVVAPVSLPEDMTVLEDAVRDREAALLILDPLVAFIGDNVNTHRDHHVRRVLARLADLAEDTGAAALVVIHTNKDAGTEPLIRISGSIGFTGAARAVLLAAEDPHDDSRRILAVVKNNLAQYPPPLAYRIQGAEVKGVATSGIEWLGEAPEVDPRELLAGRDPEERTKVAEAIEFLQESGVETVAQPAKDLERDAEDALGVTPRTLRRARQALGIPAWKDGLRGGWYWGPKGTAEGDNPTPVPLSPSPLPAETGPAAPEGDTPARVGVQELAQAEATIREAFGQEAVEVVE
jgi:Mrp family chromosome partitioning ATPase